MARYFDSRSVVTKKNKIGNAQLVTELNRINREEMMEIRMHNNAKQRFKHKYAKLDVFDENKGSDASVVVMYETHNPGFCYRRNGDCRLPPSNITNLSVDFQDIHKLVFTDDDVDIEKVLFLYLLTAHKTNSLSPPPRSQKTSFLTREQSPLERLVDRSKKRQNEVYLTSNLPLYILETPMSNLRKPIIQDPRLSAKIIINEKIVQLVHSVMAALKNANSERYHQMIMLGKNPEALKDIANQERMTRFIRVLEGQNIISSCESFYLTSNKSSGIHVLQMDTSNLEKLVLNIRRNIFTLPTSNSFQTSNFGPSFSSSDNSNRSIEVGESNEVLMVKKLDGKSKDGQSEFSTETLHDKKDDHFSLRSMMGMSNTILPRKSDKFDFKAHEIVSNLDMAYSSEFNLCTDVNLQRESKIDFEKMAVMLNEKVRKKIKREQDIFNNDVAMQKKAAALPNTTTSHLECSEDHDLTCSTTDTTISEPTPQTQAKFSLRRTLCVACRQKWKTPLPSPKTSKLRKIVMPIVTEDSFNDMNSPSTQKLSDMIDDELKRWESEKLQTKGGNRQITNRMYKSMARGSFIRNNSIEIIDLDELHLAKIRQEIKENETRKRLEKFLRS